MASSPRVGVSLIGHTIAGKYRVENVLGRGAMGVVLSAQHLGLEQLVAIKVLSNRTAQSDSIARQRFLREARLAARIRSEHVCRVLDTGALEDGTPYLVMEYLEGSDLAAELARRGRIDAVEAVRYVRQACDALSVAHAAGVIHRDLKPANLFLSKQLNGPRQLKVLDFGVSKAVSERGLEADLTKTSSLVGSPLYMSPEQLHSARTVDKRSDIWALGAILYELIAGEPPFIGETIPALIQLILHADPPRSQGLSLPDGLESAIRRALSKPYAERFASAHELSQALAPHAQHTSDSASGVFLESRQAVPLRRLTSADAVHFGRGRTHAVHGAEEEAFGPAAPGGDRTQHLGRCIRRGPILARPARASP